MSWYYYYRVVKNERLTPTIHRIYLDATDFPLPNASAGQFVMVFLPGAGEIPLSVYYQRKRRLGFIVEDFGGFSTNMVNVQNGVELGVRGPYGRGFSKEIGMRYLLIAGGSGAPPLLSFLRQSKFLRGASFTYLLGGRSSTDLFLLEEARRQGARVYAATDDGSAGFKGYVTDLARDLLAREKYDRVYACGPEGMLKEAFRLSLSFGTVYEGSFVRDVRCAVGICGLCVLEGSGLLVCKDGPVFRGSELGDLFAGV